MTDSPWICCECGSKYGQAQFIATTFHNGVCGWCKEGAGVTHFRNYGYPSSNNETRKNQSLT